MMGSPSVEDSALFVAQNVEWATKEIVAFLRTAEEIAECLRAAKPLSRRDEIAVRMMESLEFEDFGSFGNMAEHAQRMADELIARIDATSARRATEQPK